VLTSVHSRLVGTAEPCRVDTCKPERLSWTWSAVWRAASEDAAKRALCVQGYVCVDDSV